MKLVGPDLDDGEADAVDGDRALVDEVLRELGRQGDLDDLPVLGGLASYDVADAVDVALHDVTAEALLGGDGSLEVDPVAGVDLVERRLVERLLHHVGGPGTALDRDDGQAAAVDRDRVAEAGAVEHGVGGDGETDRVGEVVDRGDGAELLDDAGEHQDSLLRVGVRVKRTFGSSPSRPGSTVTSVTTGRNAASIVVIPRSPTALRPAPSRTGAT